MNRLKTFFIAVLIFVLFVAFFDCALTRQCNDLLATKDITAIKHGKELLVRDRGGLLKDEMSSDDDLLLFGTSELSFDGEQNPTKIFPCEGADYDVSIFGRPCTKSLQLAATINSTENLEENSKVAVIMTLQWFCNECGVSSDEYNANFSEYQFYKIMSDSEISKENKLYYAKRSYNLLKHQNTYQDEKVYAYLYGRNDLLGDTCLLLMKPYFILSKYIQQVKDEVQSYKLLKTMGDKTEKKVKSIDWKAEEEKAEAQSEQNADNNDLTVKNDFYDKNIRDKYDSLKDKAKDVDISKGREFEDYEFFLSVCKDKGIKPLIILMPVCGKYYDYIGISSEERQYYYDRMTEMANEYGFDTLDLRDEEYEPYYMKDIMHPGSKGWLDMDEKIKNYFSSNN